MIAAWLIIAVAVLGLRSSIGGSTSDDWSIPGTEAQQGHRACSTTSPPEGWRRGPRRVRRRRRLDHRPRRPQAIAATLARRQAASTSSP
jgi:hypothetical protein